MKHKGGKRKDGQSRLFEKVLKKGRSCQWCDKWQEKGQTVLVAVSATTGEQTIFCDLECMNEQQFRRHKIKWKPTSW
jgi:hypothetical protein